MGIRGKDHRQRTFPVTDMCQFLRSCACLIVCSTLFSGCLKKSGQRAKLAFTVRGNLDHAARENVYLSEFGEDDFEPRDTARVETDGSFSFSGEITAPDVFRISLSGEEGMPFVIDAPLINVRADARDLQNSFTAEGSGESGLLKEMTADDEKYRDAVSDLEKRFVRARDAGHSDSLVYFQEQFITLREIHAARKREFIRRHPASLAASYATWLMARESPDDAFIDSMTAAFNREIPESKYARLLNTLQKESGALSAGAPAPEIVLPQPDGSPLRLSSMRGKYVLIDFWASWCRPCREENPEMVNLYRQFRGEGFEILGVSLDESRGRWTEAIAADKLPWKHVCDLEGASGPAAIAYNVQAIPMTVLIDPGGRIVDTNLRGATLRRKLEELFDH